MMGERDEATENLVTLFYECINSPQIEFTFIGLIDWWFGLSVKRSYNLRKSVDIILEMLNNLK